MLFGFTFLKCCLDSHFKVVLLVKYQAWINLATRRKNCILKSISDSIFYIYIYVLLQMCLMFAFKYLAVEAIILLHIGNAALTYE